jgi:RNA polymerase sigma factor for flagellar operon FliA
MIPDDEAGGADLTHEPQSLADVHDEPELWSFYKRTGDEAARERLILHHAPLVKFVAGRLRSGLPSTVDPGDLYSDGMFGLFDAIEKFDPGLGIKFETYAQQRIKGAIYDRLRTMDWVPRSVRSKIKAVDQAHERLELELQRTPTDEEVADAAGVTLPELRGVYTRTATTSVLSLDRRIGGQDDQSTLGELLAPSTGEVLGEDLEDAELKQALLRGVRLLPENDRIVITLYYFEEVTLAEIGQVLGVTESRACQLHGRAQKRLRAHLTAHV